MKKTISLFLGAIVAMAASAGINANRDVSVPYNIYCEQGAHSCLVRWDDDDNSAWNLRYRLYTEASEEPVMLHSLSGSSYTGSYADVTLPAPWGGVNTRGGQGAIYIKNNYNNVARGTLTYTIPEGYTNGIFVLSITSSSGTYGSGNFTVYSAQTTDVAHTFSGGETYQWTVTASSGEQITVYSTDNNYSPDIAQIAVYYAGQNWTYVYNLSKKKYTIEDLEMETEYEVQVQGIGDNGSVSNWSRSDVFMTLDEEPIETSVHIMGEVDDQLWAADAGTKMEYDEETELYTATVHVKKDKTFGFSTEIDNDQGSWEYVNQFRFGPESDSLLLLTDELLGQQLPISFDNYADIQILRTSDYEVTVSLERNYIIIGRISAPEHEYEKGDVNHDGNISIADVAVLIDYLLGIDNDACEICADVNDNGEISIADVTALIDKLLIAPAQ